MKQVLNCIATSGPSNSAASFQSLVGNIGPDATETRRRQLFNEAGTLHTARIRWDAAPGSGKSWTFTLRKGNPSLADTSLVIVIADTAVEGSSTVKVQIAAGDWVSWRIDPSGTPAGLYPGISITFEADVLIT